jgi:hypothetical protein
MRTSVLHARLRGLVSLALPVALVALAACSDSSDGNQTTNPAGDGGRDSAASTVAAGDSGPDSATSDSAASDSSTPLVIGDAEAGTCVDLEPSPAELTCATDQDCALVVTGPVCSGYELGALCENGVANSSGVARITAQIAAIPHGNDAGHDVCDISVGTPRCLQGMCIDCDLGRPAGCLDAGTMPTGDGSPE